MRQEPADFSILARWTLPAAEDAPLLEDHALVVRDGRILAILPRTRAAQAYATTLVLERPAHIVLPGLIDSAVDCGDWSAPAATAAAHGEDESARRIIGTLLRSGITCCAARGPRPELLARAAADLGARAIIGLPAGREGLSRALDLRDRYQAHPLVGTAFAPRDVNGMDDTAFARLATLVDELDARVMIDLHASEAEIAQSLARHGKRPIERLAELGLLSPSLQAVHMCLADAQDLELAERTGIGISLCPLADIDAGRRLPPAAAIRARARAALGSGGAGHLPPDLWTDVKLAAALLRTGSSAAAARQALQLATRGGAAVLGLEADIGALEAGRWADLCCVEIGEPAGIESDPVTQLVFGGRRDRVSDVWVAGRQLLSNSAPTRLE